MQRTFIEDLTHKKGEIVLIKGWVDVRRDQGKMIFFEFRDMTGKVQGVILPSYTETLEVGKQLRNEYVVSVEGKVNERPERNRKADIQNGDIELEIQKITILAKSEPLPFDMGAAVLEAELPVQLDHRALTLRHPRVQAVFKVQNTILDSFREVMKQNKFFEFQAPSIVPATAEGGAEVFQIDYFDKRAFLSQSPQLYKQVVMTAFERVYSVNKVFRAEPSTTTRHLTEIVSLDAEMGFIDSWTDVRDMIEVVLRHILTRVGAENAAELAQYDAVLPVLIEKTPTMSLVEAQALIFEKKGKDVRGEKDLNPEDERMLCDIVKESTGSDFVFVYGYPTKKKPFYVYPNPENPEFNEGVDLLCRGIEWLSGGRRVNDFEQLQRHVKEWGMDPNKIKMFLDAFRYGAPPEGGFAFGLERMVMQILGLKNVREATMFPRDMERIDERFSAEV
jgi:nondiscriminating aspartyl-tRNA synthetase